MTQLPKRYPPKLNSSDDFTLEVVSTHLQDSPEVEIFLDNFKSYTFDRDRFGDDVFVEDQSLRINYLFIFMIS